MRVIPATEAAQRVYDVVIVGGGLAGALVAKRLSKDGRSVLIVEAGTGQGESYGGYLGFLNTFYTELAKTPEAPYPTNPNAPQPTVLDVNPITPGHPDTAGYFVQMGPQPFRSTYDVYLGGTTLHWLGTTLRMLPDDFEMRTRFGVAENWPIRYDQLGGWYAAAEGALGVSAEVAEQAYGGITFPPGYVYPMHGQPASFGDQVLAEAVDGMVYEVDGVPYPLKVTGTPVARNGIPNKDYNGGQGYQPIGAVGNPAVGQRCQGNTNCVPICPVQAKFNALKVLFGPGMEHVDMVVQTVASRLEVADGRIASVTAKHYFDTRSPAHEDVTFKGKLYVLAAHAVENAKLLLASGVANSSDQVGRNLMDHTELQTWGLMPQRIGAFRGPLATSGIESMRPAQFRGQMAAFRIEIGNDGWAWPTGAPNTDVTTLVDTGNLYGKALKRRLAEQVSRQVRCGFLVEQLPEAVNRVTIDPQYKDQLGEYRPVISYNVSDYTRAGFALGRQVATRMFQQAGIEDYTVYDPGNPGYVTYQGQGYVYYGAGHFMGTHRMGSSAATSVVDTRQRSWDHDNLYLVGCGNMVTSGTSNPTLTMTALTLWAAENIAEDLKR